MMPLSQVLAYNTEHLIDAAAHWQGLADQREEVFASVRNEARALPWDGQAADATHQRTQADHDTAMGSAENLRAAAMIAKDGASTLDQMHSRALYTIEDAHADGFAPTEALAFVDTRPTANPAELAQRQAQAQAYTGQLQSHVANLVTHDTQVGADMSSATAGEGKIQFADTSGGIPSLPQPPSVGSAVSHGGNGGVHMVGHGFKTDAPPPVQSADPTPGGTAVHRQPLPMGSAPPTAIGPKSDPSKHDPRPGELEEDTGKVAAGIGGELLLPEAAGIKGPLSIGEDLLEGKPPSPGDGLKTVTGAFGGFELAKSGLEDAIHANPPAMKPDFIDDWLHDSPHFWEDGTGSPTR